MANVGPNKGRRLGPALSRFSAMLIEEVKDLTGLTYEKIDEALDIPIGCSFRYSRRSGKASAAGNKKERSPQPGDMKRLERKVATYLGRPAHNLVVENNENIDLDDLLKDLSVAELDSGLNLRKSDADDLQIGYEGDWPTYRRLKSANQVDLYRWQWRIKWDPKVRQELGDEEVERRIMKAYEECLTLRESMKMREWLKKNANLLAGNLPEIDDDL